MTGRDRNGWKLRLLVLAVLSPIGARAAVGQEEVGFREEYALAADRAAVLKKLVPGTEDYYFYHCLYLQQTQKYPQADALLTEWEKKRGRTAGWKMIRHRQALLTYPNDPARTLEYLRRELGLAFTRDPRRGGQTAQPFPSRLDPQLISREKLARDLLKNPRALTGFNASAFYWLASRELTPQQRHELLRKLDRPDVPGLVEMVHQDLRSRATSGFGQLKVHALLTREQLDELAERYPAVRNQPAFVQHYLIRLLPSDDERRDDEAVQQRHLERLWKFAKDLPPVHNSLKTHVLFHRLQWNLRHGKWDKDLFMAYLKLPRRAGYVNPTFLQAKGLARYAADLNANFTPITLRPPVGNDERLVRAYLEHFFQQETGYEEYLRYLRDSFVKRVFAETKILYGLGDPQEWTRFLSPAEYAEISKRVELRFAPTNRRWFSSGDPVAIEVDVKNVPTLLVKIYRINCWNYYRSKGRPVNTDIDLDGLVPNWEQRHTYRELPQRRVRRRFEFPELKEPGVYVIDFIGNGKQSRVVLRKGRLELVTRTTPAGQRVTILDENREPVPGATLWLGGRVFRPDEQGSIVIPFSSKPSTVPVVLSNGEFHDLGWLTREGESYSLNAGFLVNRESLIAGREATVGVRPQLYLNGHPVSLTLLQDVRLVVRITQDRDISTSSQVRSFELGENREATYTFRVPPRTQSIRLELSATVKTVTTRKKVDLSATKLFELNKIDSSLGIAQMLLENHAGEYRVSLVGRNGEPLPGQLIRLHLIHRDFEEPVHVILQTDETGQVHLGRLFDITTVKALALDQTGSGSQAANQVVWHFNREDHSWREVIHSRTDEAIEVPLVSGGDKLDRSVWSLFALRGGQFAHDEYSKLAVRDGLLRIEGLAAGDYRLVHHPTSRQVLIRVVDGKVVDHYAVGKARAIEIDRAPPLQIAEVQVTDQRVRLRLIHGSEYARVHVLANRYIPAYDTFGVLAAVGGVSPAWRPSLWIPTLYLQERAIGDEYRYILDRRAAKKYPGNMLARPSLLLDPWAVQTTERQETGLGRGDVLGRSPAPTGSAELRAHRGSQASGTREIDFDNLDFLAEPGRVWLNLKPDQEGWVEIDRSKLGTKRHLLLVAVDPDDTVVRELALPTVEEQKVDLRLVESLDVQRHYIQTKKVEVIPKGKRLVIADFRSSRVKIYDELSELMSLYLAFQQSSVDVDVLKKFRFITHWPELDDDRKRELYSEYACYELNVFLYYKDPAFFQQVVKPHLVHKSPKRFVDDWLLGQPLDGYSEAWQRGQLNAFERAALAQKQKPNEFIRLDVLPALQQQDQRSESRRWFELALYGGAMEAAITLKGGYGLPDDSEDLAHGAQSEGKALEKMADKKNKSGLLGRYRRPMPKSARRSAPGRPQAPAADADSPGSRLRPQEQGSSRDKPQNGYFDADRRARRELAEREMLFIPLDQTRSWAESYYYHVALRDMNSGLVPWSRMWTDFAAHQGGRGFLSPHLARAHHNATEVLLALAVTDLPFRAEKHEMKLTDGKMEITAASPFIAFHEQIERIEPGEVNAAVLVSQMYFNPHVSESENGVIRDREFLVNTSYGCRVVLSNPSSRKRVVDVLMQIPAGAIAVAGSRATESRRVVLEPYSTKAVRYFFYFPEEGEFDHFPAHVAEGEELVAFAPVEKLTVVRRRTRLDKASWVDVARNGTADEVIAYLENHSLLRTDLGLIEPRMRDRAFYDRVMSLLEKRNHYDHRLASYALYHGDSPQRIGRYLEHATAFVNQCGLALSSPLLTLDPIAQKRYEHIEFRPLVNARVHPIGSKRIIENVGLRKQYQTFLDWLCQLEQIDDDRRLELTYYLLLQDRIEEALEHFSRIDPEKVTRRMQYDYCAAYLKFFDPDAEPAREIAQRYVDYPVPRWRNAFREILAQLDEIETGRTHVVNADDREQRQAAAAAKSPVLDLATRTDSVVIHHRNLERARLNFYPMDIELLFSRNPFVQQQYGDRFGQVHPYRSVEVKLEENASETRVEIPQELRSQHLLVEVVGEGQSVAKVRFASALRTELVETQGMLRVVGTQTGRPLPQVYVKVFARLKSGQVRFYKDGYTDLRGRFDYATLSSDLLNSVDRFAVLVLSEKEGAVIREVPPPRQ